MKFATATSRRLDINTYLTKRTVNGRELPAWQLRIPVPRHLHTVLGKKEVWKSLRTSDRAEASRRAIPIVAEQFADWDNATTRTAANFDPVTVAVMRTYEPLKAALHKIRRETPRGGPRDAMMEMRERQSSILSERVLDEDYQAYEERADRLLVEAGIRDRPDVRLVILSALADSASAGVRDFLRDVESPGDSQPSSALVRDVIAKEADKAEPGKTLEELFELYAAIRVRERRKRASSIPQDRMVIKLFADFVGRQRSPHSISIADAREFRNTIARLPRGLGKLKAYRGLSVKEAADKADRDGASGMSDITLARYMSTVSPFFDWLKTEGYTDSQPFDGLHQRPDRGRNPRPPFSIEQLNEIFQSPLFTCFLRDKREAVAGNVRADDFRYWIPLLCLFTGSRINEVAQLRVNDIIDEHVDQFIVLRHDERTGQVTKSSRTRVIPVHRSLARLGLVNFVTRCADAAAGISNPPLFPELRAKGRDNVGQRASRFWREYLEDIGIKSGADGLGSHSFRHGLADELRRAGFMDYDIGPLVLGHSNKTVTSGYGMLSQGNATTRRKMMDAVRFDGLQIDHLFIR